MNTPSNTPLTVAGLSGVALNIAAVGLLWGSPHAYKPGDLSQWRLEVLHQPTLALLSAWAFTLGLVALAAFGAMLSDAAAPARPGWVRLGGWLFAFGALLDAAGTMAPAVVARFAMPASLSEALLAMSLALDASFNVLLGLGLLCINFGLGPSWPRWLRALGLLAGAVSLPLALQLQTDDWARLLAVSGPLWLVWVSAASWRLRRA